MNQEMVVTSPDQFDRSTAVQDRDRRFQAAFESIIRFEPRERTGIGMQKEKSVHAILKNYFDPDPSHQEIPVGKFIADICDEEAGSIVEVQTAHMGNLREKLSVFLPDYRVTLVYPIPHRKTVNWIDPETGELLASNRSHFIGSFYEVFRELYQIDAFLTEPNLTIAPILLDMTEYRIQDGWGNSGKRGSHRFDRVPERIYDELLLREPKDYAVFLPLQEQIDSGAGESSENRPIWTHNDFTAKDLEAAVGIHRKSISYSTILRILTELGVTERIGMTARRAYRYRTLIENNTGVSYCRGKTAGRNHRKD